MSSKTKNLITRTITGAVYITLMIVGTLYAPLMAVLMCLFACIGIHEYSKMISGPIDRFSKVALLCATVVLFAIVLYEGYLNAYALVSPTTKLLPYLLYATFILFLITALLGVSEIFRRRACPIEHLGAALWGYGWIVLPLSFIAMMTMICYPIVLAFFILIWTYDTFAYLGGSLYGKNKMCEHISPKKTWEGTFTGLVAATVIALVFPSMPFFGDLMLATWKWVIFALITVIFGTFGDLLESIFKRNASLKDSGRFLPGHGGILDRCDSMLLASIPALMFILFQLL